MTMKNNKRKKEAERLSKQQQEKRRKQRKKRRILTAMTLLLIIIGGSAFALISPIFNIKDIQVLDNSQVSSETIQSLSGLHTDENIFRFLKINVRQAIKKEPYIEDVSIKRNLPSTVQITVKERVGRFSIKFLNGYAIISSQGYILELAEDNKRTTYS